MTTAIDILREAYATSRLNEAERIADESGELLTLLNDRLRYYMAMGARKNRTRFGGRLVSAYDANAAGWPIPQGAEMVLRLEAGSSMTSPVIAAGTEVALLPYDQRHIEPQKPAVYTLGAFVYPAGRAVDPGNGNLVFLTASAPAAIPTLTSPLPIAWPETFDSILKWEIAIYLAQKDGERDNEVAAFNAQLMKETTSFMDYVESLFLNETRSYGHGGRFTSPKVTPR